MEAFPVKVGLLSRFRTAKQQKETLRGLQAGSVDIVIGTHRLLSKTSGSTTWALSSSTRSSVSASSTRRS